MPGKIAVEFRESRVRKTMLGTLTVLMIASMSPFVGKKAEMYVSQRVDSAGELHISTDSGRDIVAQREKGQVAFGDPAISPDGRSVVWLVEYDDSEALGFQYDPIAGEVVVFKNGHIVHRFKPAGTIWAWQFVSDDRIAFTFGPLHGNPYGCELRDLNSGALIQRWYFKEGATLPKWATGIRCDGVD